MKKYIFSLFLLFTALLIFPKEYGDIDWINGRIYSSTSVMTKNDNDFAENRLEGVNFAKEEAKVNFYRVLKKINIYESLTVLDYFEEKIEKNRELFSLIDKAKLHKIEYPDINSVKLVYYIDIYGKDSLMNIMISERDIFTEDLIGYMGYHYDTKYTGLLIDARGILTSYDGYEVKVKPSLFVTIKDSEGRLVFNQNNVLPEVIKNKGMVRYSYDILENQTRRVGIRPLKIVAFGTGDRSGSHIVVSELDAKRMLASETTRNAIKNGWVVIIIDP